MTTRNKILIGAAILIFILGLLAGMGLHRSYINRNTISAVPDTVYVQQEIDIPVPSLAEHKVDSTDKIDIPIQDVRVSADSSSIEAPKETVTYRDSTLSGVSYTATVTGVQPSLTSLRFSVPERRITQTVYKPIEGWSLAGFANADYSSPVTSVSGGASLSYCTGPFDFHFDIGVQRTWHPSLAPTTTPYIGVGTKVTFLRFNKR